MKPSSFIIANQLRLFNNTVKVAAEFAHHLSGEVYYKQFDRLHNIYCNPFARRAAYYERHKEEFRHDHTKQLDRYNINLQAFMYKQIIHEGALRTLKAVYEPDEEDAHRAVEMDSVLYQSFRTMYACNSKKTSMKIGQLEEQKQDLERFPDYQQQAERWLKSYFHPVTSAEARTLQNMRQNMLAIDLYTGHLTPDLTRRPIIYPSLASARDRDSLAVQKSQLSTLVL